MGRQSWPSLLDKQEKARRRGVTAQPQPSFGEGSRTLALVCAGGPAVCTDGTPSPGAGGLERVGGDTKSR